MLKVLFGIECPFITSEWRFSLSPQSHQERRSTSGPPREGLLQLQDNMQFSSMPTP